MSSTSTVSVAAGDVVETVYGVGVIVEDRQRKKDGCDNETNISNNSPKWVVRLWRRPGQSIANAAQAVLQPKQILRVLPAAPGMTTSLVDTDEKVLVHAYLSHRQVYLCSRLCPKDDPVLSTNQLNSSITNNDENHNNNNNNNIKKPTKLLEYPVNALKPAPAAKFWPLLETLMQRGDATAQRARRHLLEKPSATQKVVTQTGKALQQQQRKQQQIQQLQQSSDSLPNLSSPVLPSIDTTTLAQQAPQVVQAAQEQYEAAKPALQAQFQQVLTMLQDREITTLLNDAQERLKVLTETDLSQAAVEALAKQGIRFDDTEQKNEKEETTAVSKGVSIPQSLHQSRKVALEALEGLLQQADLDAADLQAAQGELAETFGQALDALAQAAQSDRNLAKVWEHVTDKTVVWQESTGRLWQTRSASLFVQGATRLQARAAALWKVHQRTTSAVGSQMTKAFTEGDAAIARIKSIQLGDALKDRLVKAIEVRSDSLGGLDAIIAGALSSAGGEAEDIQSMLTAMQASASAATTNARETLLSVLSSQNTYRDVALAKLEQVLCDLDSQFEIPPADIAALATGQGGTAKLFEPIARKAWAQIETQLDEAESQVSDANVLQGLQRVRKIMSGELTLAALTDEIVSVLNDENVVAAGEVFVQKGEEVLDVLEGVSSNKVVTDALKIAEKAGITKDSVMREIQKLDVDQLLDTAGGVVTDEAKRREVVSQAIDTALDFILRILPSMPVPPFEGVRDGLLYNISNLSMAGFKVKKEDIMIELAGMRALKRSNSSQSDASKVPNDVRTSNGDPATTLNFAVGESDDSMEIEEIKEEVNASELLIIDVSRISAVLDDTEWSFEQTYMPYLKGEGKADVRMSDGAIRLQFELRKRRKLISEDAQSKDEGKNEWEPVLCLHDRSCSIDEVELKMQGESRITWLVNKAATIFKNPLRDYVVRTIVKLLTNKSGWLLEKLNGVLAPYWDLILSTAKLNMDDLLEADDNVVTKEVEKEDPSLVELVWRERLPLGMNLLMNDGSGQLKVVDFPRGSQARVVAEKRSLDPELFKGATLVAVNGTFFDDQDDLFEALKDPARPKTVQFRLAESADAEKVRKFVERDKPKEADLGPVERKFELRTLTSNGGIGIQFKASPDKCGLLVSGFVEGQDGVVLEAERSGKVDLGDLLTHVNGNKVVATDGTGQAASLEALASHDNTKPLVLSFTEPYLFEETVQRPVAETGDGVFGGPEELILEEIKQSAGARRLMVKKFKPMSGKAEGGGILLGDYIAFVNGMAFGAGRRWLGEPRNESLDELHEVLYSRDFYPMGLTFARPKAAAAARWGSTGYGDFSDMDADTICITVETPDRLGCVFEMYPNGDIVVKDFTSVPGIFNRTLTKLADTTGHLHVAIDSIDGQFVPSYATTQMVQNALKRSWNSEKKQVDLWLCDDEKRDWVQALE